MPAQLITLLIVVGLFVLVVLPAATLMIRRRRPELEKARTAPFTYGVAPPPSPARTSCLQFPVAGQPATLSIWDPRATGRAAPGGYGTLLLELPLGPQWPMFVTMPRSVGQGIGLLVAKQQRLAGQHVPTGDPDYDTAFWTGAVDSAPEDVLRVLGPRVRAALTHAAVRRMYVVHKLGVSVGLDVNGDVDAQIAALCRLAELVVHDAGIPTHHGPPATFGPGAPWAPS